METDYTIVGGGVVGLSVAHGLLGLGRRVVVLDEGDDAFRASRGNFGLVWVQGKGVGAPAYARWTRGSAALWREFARELADESRVDLALSQQGGFDYHLSEETLAERLAQYAGLRDALGGDYPYEVLGPEALRREEPNVGPEVVGAILHPEDGHLNPLRLLRALVAAVGGRGGQLRTGAPVQRIRPDGGGFRVETPAGSIRSQRVVLCAGLGNAVLGPALGFHAPLRPQRGQNLITEKTAPLMRRPSGILRQVDEGGVQIGDSKEEVGYDDRTTLGVTAAIAARAVRIFPALASVRVNRAWAGLRILSPDGLPIYQRSASQPGAFLVNCHSGITLAAAHSRLLPRWLDDRADAPDLEAFSESRFELSAA